jgi:Holliday junction resolvase
MVNSIKKGKCFEREVANLLGKITQTTYMRIPQSGGTATNWNLSNLSGDIIPKEVLNGTEKQKYVIECKATKKALEIQDFFNEKSLFFEFIKQTKMEVERISSEEWYLFIKIKNKGTYLVTDDKGVLSLLFEDKPTIVVYLKEQKCKFIKIN